MSLGESIGFLAPVMLQQLASRAAAGMTLPLLVLAGLAEGALLGWSQAHVLKRLLPSLSAWRWTLLTSVAAAVAWFLGLGPSELGHVWISWPAALQLVAGAFAGIALLASIGVAQWLELRRHVSRSWPWIPGTAAAWCVGLVIFLAIATPLWEPGQPPELTALIAVFAGMTMAVSMALVTGLVVLRTVFSEARPKP